MPTSEPRRLLARAGPLVVVLLIGAGPGAIAVDDYRSLDGSGNNPDAPRMGSTGMSLMRVAAPQYDDGIGEPMPRPNPRAVSNAVFAQPRPRPSRAGVSDLFWMWGQFLDHDLSLTSSGEPAEPMPIPVPAGDPYFDPDGFGDQVIPFFRSAYAHETGGDTGLPRAQVNELSAWIDASQVYGVGRRRAQALRRLDGSGALRTSPGHMLPFNADGFPNHGGTLDTLYLAGDVRANEHVGLTAMHTLWVREHNRKAREIRRASPRLGEDEVYERARAWVGGLMQAITYTEFLPLLLGPDALGEYAGWDPTVDGTISQEFSTAAYRFGHTMVSPQLLRLRKNGRPVRDGHLTLQRAFFAPHEIDRRTGIEPYLRGAAAQHAQELDTQVIDALRNFLFGPPGSGGMDLVSLNIQRGRDHGLPDFNRVRRAYGLAPLRGFRELSPNTFVVQDIRSTYQRLEDLDLWVGGLAEDHVRGAMVGPTFHTILVDQFRRLRDADRYFYRRIFAGAELAELQSTTLADVVRRNARISGEIQDAVFLVPAPAAE